MDALDALGWGCAVVAGLIAVGLIVLVRRRTDLARYNDRQSSELGRTAYEAIKQVENIKRTYGELRTEARKDVQARAVKERRRVEEIRKVARGASHRDMAARMRVIREITEEE